MDRDAWQEAERERAFWQEHHEAFLRQYTDQFVAVKDGGVVATSYDLRDLLSRLKAQGLDPRTTWMHFFASDAAVALL